jgi:hypothetical protein
MSVTYPADPTKPYGDRIEMPRVDPHAELTNDEPFVPVYARRGKARTGQSKIKSWMILAPVGAIVLGGIGAMMFMGGSEEVATPLAEPAATAPVVSALPAPVDAATAPLTPQSAPAPVAAAPVVREATPVRRAAPAPTPRREAAPAPAPTAPRVVTPAPAAGPQPYAPAPAASPTSTLNTATPAPSPTPAPPPAIVVQPLG